MSSTKFTLPRRSARIAPKRWAAHFASYPTYNEGRIYETIAWINKVLDTPFEERHQKFDGVNDALTQRCIYYGTLYNYLMYNPRFLVENQGYKNLFYANAIFLLGLEHVQNSKNWWVKHLKATLHDFLQMLDYLPHV